MKKFSKAAGYKIKIQKSFAFLYTNNKLLERTIKKAIPFIIVQNNRILNNKFKQGTKRSIHRKL